MKTPAEFEPIALWMGMRKVKPFGMTEVWYRANGEVSGKVSEKTSLTDAEAVEALRRLEDKDYCWAMESYSNKSKAMLITIGDKILVESGCYPTIAAAVEEALLRMIAAEEVQA